MEILYVVRTEGVIPLTMFYVSKHYYKLLIVFALIAIIFLSPVRSYLTLNTVTSVVNQTRGTPSAPFIYLLVYIVGVVLACPGIALTALSGPIFGFWQGVVLVIIASNIGCQISFFMARIFGKGFVDRFVEGNRFTDVVAKRVEDNGFLFVLYLRLIPIFPVSGVNYISGLTTVRYRDYVLATFLGMLPGTFLFVYLSAAAIEIKHNPVGIVMPVGLLMLFTLLTTALRRKQLLLK